MKQLTKEQVKAIVEWLDKHTDSDVQFPLGDMFLTDFEPSCCDSCADGEHCESEVKPFILDSGSYEETKARLNDIMVSVSDINEAQGRYYYLVKKSSL